MPRKTEPQGKNALLERAAVDYVEALTPEEVEKLPGEFTLHVLLGDVYVPVANFHGTGMIGREFLLAGTVIPEWVPNELIAGFVARGVAAPVGVPVKVVRAIRDGVRFPASGR